MAYWLVIYMLLLMNAIVIFSGIIYFAATKVILLGLKRQQSVWLSKE